MNDNSIQIVKVTFKEVDELLRIGRQTFYESFSEFNTKEDMNAYLLEKFSHEQVVLELKNPESKFYFAKNDNEILGYLKLNFGAAQTEINTKNALEIERIYVLKAYQGKKIGQMLYQKSLDIALKNRVPFIWLGVWEKNPRAIKFYQKNGFVAFDKHTFVLGTDVQTDIMMKLKLLNE